MWPYDPFVCFSDLIKDIQDPEKPETLEELEVVYEEGVNVAKIRNTDAYHIKIEFTPTVPHCSLATLIGEQTKKQLSLKNYFRAHMGAQNPIDRHTSDFKGD